MAVQHHFAVITDGRAGSACLRILSPLNPPLVASFDESCEAFQHYIDVVIDGRAGSASLSISSPLSTHPLWRVSTRVGRHCAGTVSVEGLQPTPRFKNRRTCQDTHVEGAACQLPARTRPVFVEKRACTQQVDSSSSMSKFHPSFHVQNYMKIYSRML